MVTRAFPVWQITGFIALSTLGGTVLASAEASGAALEEITVSEWRQGAALVRPEAKADTSPQPSAVPRYLAYRSDQAQDIKPLGFSLEALGADASLRLLHKSYLPLVARADFTVRDYTSRENRDGYGFAVRYRFDDDSQAYLKAARGTVVAAYTGSFYEQAVASGFEPDYALSYEAGLTQRWGALGLRADAFYAEYRNYSTQAVGMGGAGSSRIPGRMPVAGLARFSLYGTEWTLDVATGGWRAWATVGFLGASYNEYKGTMGYRAFSGRDLSPDTAFAAGLSYDLVAVGAGELAVSLDYQHLASHDLADVALPRSEHAGTVNLGFNWSEGRTGWKLRAGVNNLFDSRYRTSLSAMPVLDGDGATTGQRTLFLSAARGF